MYAAPRNFARTLCTSYYFKTPSKSFTIQQCLHILTGLSVICNLYNRTLIESEFHDISILNHKICFIAVHQRKKDYMSKR